MPGPDGPHAERPACASCCWSALFLPFFIGQVVRAYGWLIVLGKQGLLNAGLAALGLPDGRASSTPIRAC